MTLKRRQFVLEYLANGCNAAAAAKAAGYRWPRSQGSRILQQPAVRRLVLQAQARLAAATGTSVAQQARRLERIAKLRLSDLGEIGPDGRLVIDVEQLHRTGKLPLVKRLQHSIRFSNGQGMLSTAVELPDQAYAAAALAELLGGYSPGRPKPGRRVRVESAPVAVAADRDGAFSESMEFQGAVKRVVEAKRARLAALAEREQAGEPDAEL